MIHVVAGGGRTERLALLDNEMKSQNEPYRLWDGVHDSRSVVRSINLSHKQIVEYAYANNLPEITIGEDDLRFTHQDSLKFYRKNKPDKFDVYLAGVYLGDIKEDNTVNSFCALHLYTVHWRFYETFLSLPEDQHLDRAMSDMGLFKVCVPFIATQHDHLFSSNTGKVEDYSELLRNYKLYEG